MLRAEPGCGSEGSAWHEYAIEQGGHSGSNEFPGDWEKVRDAWYPCSGEQLQGRAELEGVFVPALFAFVLFERIDSARNQFEQHGRLRLGQ